MNITLKGMAGLWIAGSMLVGVSQLSACTTDDDDSRAGTDGSSGSTGGSGESTSGTGGGGGGATGDGGPSGTVCASSIALESATPDITDFENYDGGADLTTWSFALGGESATGVFSGTFMYGDEADGFPEMFEMVEGNDSIYAFSISDSEAEEYGGGMGLWLSSCIDASAFSGITFWVRGNAPTGEAKFNIFMQETTPDTTDEADANVGTCAGMGTACVAPSFTFAVTDEWTQVSMDWADFDPGSAAGTAVQPDGSNIWQLQFDIGLVFDDITPTPAPYELVIDDMAFH